jgi:V8-like Glu-specific endopeptidase
MLIGLLITTAISLAGTIDPSVPDSKYINYGSKFECVVQIYGNCLCKGENDPHEFSASAVVIKPHYIITAAHVVKDTTDVNIKVGQKKYKISKIIVNKDFEKGNFGYNDIALGYCEEEIKISFYPDLYEKNDEVLKVVSICGYGMKGTFSTGTINSDGVKRAGSNVIDKIERNCLVCSVDEKRKTELEFMIGSGDSGGGLFLDGKLAGINSFVSADDGKPSSSYGDECGHTRVSSYINWIKENLKDEQRNSTQK